MLIRGYIANLRGKTSDLLKSTIWYRNIWVNDDANIEVIKRGKNLASIMRV